MMQLWPSEQDGITMNRLEDDALEYIRLRNYAASYAEWRKLRNYTVEIQNRLVRGHVAVGTLFGLVTFGAIFILLAPIGAYAGNKTTNFLIGNSVRYSKGFPDIVRRAEAGMALCRRLM